MENTSSEMNGKLEDHQDSLSHSYSCDGYERLHDEAMEKISVSIHYSDLEESLSGNSRNSLTKANENQEKKMKISLSQEQLRLKNFLSVPKITKKSASFSASDEKDGRNLVKIDLEVPAEGPKNIISSVSSSASQNVIVTSANAESDSGEYDEIIYAVPRKNSTRVLRREITLKTSSASSSPSKSVTIAQTSSAFALDGNYKYPLSFYCKICNNILNDPRTLDCLHSFCVQCLARLDVTNDLQNNQFWRKISDSSYQAPSVSSVLSSYESDKSQKAKFSISGSVKNRRFFKDKSPTRSVKGRHSSIISFTEKPKSIICPTCGTTTEMTIHGVFRLPQHTLLERKIQEAIGGTRERISICQLCSFNVDATFTCDTCNYKLCINCKDTHKRQSTHHDFKSLEKAKKRTEKSFSKDTAIKCLIHGQNELKLFCTTCCTLICSECTILIHRGHKMTSVQKAAKVYIETLREAKDNTKPLSTYAIHSISKLGDVSKKINQKCDIVEKDVEVFLSEYFEALEVHKRTLLHQIERCRQTKMDMIKCQQLDLERRSNEAKTAISFTENLLTEGTDEENLMFLNLLLRKFDSCRSNERTMDVKITDSVQFLPQVKAPSNQAQKNIPLYGIITTQIAVAKNCTLETSTGLMNLRAHKKAELVLQTRDIEHRDMCHGSADVDITATYRNVQFKTIPVQVTDKRDGTYLIHFIPDSPGIMEISIRVNGKSIQGSPFTIRARNLRPHAGLFHCCSFCSSNGKKVCACNGRMEVDGYLGCGHGHIGWPGRRHWSCCSSLLENSECSFANAISNENLAE